MSYILGEDSIEIPPPESNDLKRFQFLACDDMYNTLEMVRNLLSLSRSRSVFNS